MLEGWLRDRIVCRREVGESRYAAGITARADDSVLYADGDTYDATRNTVKAGGQYGKSAALYPGMCGNPTGRPR